MDISEKINTAPTQEDELEAFLDLTPELVRKRRSQGKIIFDRFIRNRAAIGGLAFLVLLILACFLAPFITGHNQPDVIHLSDTLQGPSLRYPFGTDDLGRVVFALVIFGGTIEKNRVIATFNTKITVHGL